MGTYFWDNMSIDDSKKYLKALMMIGKKYFKAEEHTILYKARNLALKKHQVILFVFLIQMIIGKMIKIEKQL